MGFYSYDSGPYLDYVINGVRTPSFVPAWERVASSTTLKRPRPVKLDITNHGREERQESRTVVTLWNGNQAPISDYISTSANASSVQADVDAADALAAGNLRRAVKDTTWEAATSVAELGQTLKFLLETSTNMVRAYKLARKGDVLGLSELYHKYDFQGKARKPAWKRVSNTWLQWRYAVRPLIMDLDDMIHELARSRIEPVVIRTQGHHTVWVDKVIQDSVIGNDRAFRRRNGTVRVSYVADYIRTGSPSLTQLGFTNMPALLWELTPFSFVVDNFIPIGQYLAGIDALNNTSYLRGYRVERHLWAEYASYRNGVSRSQIKKYSRSQVTDFPGQSLPRWQAPKGDIPSKVLDALALLGQVVTGRRR